MNPEYEYGEKVRVVRTIRDDGTFPGRKRGDKLITKGSVGYVRDVGVFLQDQLIYQVHFIEEDLIVGCRSQELISADEPWIESEFEFGDWVLAANHLAIQGEVIAEVGKKGQVMSVRRDLEPIRYEVLFDDRMLLVPLSAICWPPESEVTEEALC